MREEERGRGFISFRWLWRRMEALRLNETLLESGTLRYGCNGFIV